MKKFSLSIMLCLMLVVLGGCSPTTHLVKINSIKTSPHKLVKIKEIIPHTKGVDIVFENNSDKTAEIVLNKSKIDGSIPLLGYSMQPNKMQPNEIIPPKSEYTLKISPSNNYNVMTGSMKDMTYPIKLIICVKQGGEEEFIYSTIGGTKTGKELRTIKKHRDTDVALPMVMPVVVY